jgi:uncharacterized protein YcbK (DUF882 family)
LLTVNLKYNSQAMSFANTLSRRGVLKAALVAAFTSFVLPLRRARADDKSRLKLLHTHTGKRLDVVYKRGGNYLPEGLKQLNEFLFDFRTGDVVEIDPSLLDLLYELRQKLGSDGTYEVISAYRSPATNDMLRRRSSGVAKNSQHVYGKAIDVRLTGTELSDLRDAAIAMRGGGVGYYASSNFVHIDTGRVRYW